MKQVFILIVTATLVACGGGSPLPVPSPTAIPVPTAAPIATATAIPPTPTAAVTPTPTPCVPSFFGVNPCVPTPAPTAAQPTATPTAAVPATPTPCVNLPGPGGFNPCGNPSPGPTTIPPTPAPTAVVVVTATPVPMPAGTPAPGVSGMCTLTSPPSQFEPNPPGVKRPAGTGGSTALVMYRNGAGTLRLINAEAWGYSVLDLSNPMNPTALLYDDMRFDSTNPIPQHGDGQSYIATTAVSPDGQRAAFSVNGPADPPWHTLASQANQNGFITRGDFPPNRAYGTVIQHVGSRYIAYSQQGTTTTAADITTLPTAFAPLNVTYEKMGTVGGMGLTLVGNYLIYQTSGLVVYDASAPGPVGSITSAYKSVTIKSSPVNYASALDPADPTKLWILEEFQAATGEKSPSYGLVAVTKDASGNLTATVMPGLFKVPAAAGETWTLSGESASLVASNGTLFAVMWARRSSPSVEYVLYSGAVNAWPNVTGPGTVLTPSSPFGLAATSAKGILAGSGTNVYQYLPSGAYAYVVPLTCKP